MCFSFIEWQVSFIEMFVNKTKLYLYLQQKRIDFIPTILKKLSYTYLEKL